MADNLEYVTILCEGGLDTTENHLFLDSAKPGSASNIINYEVGLYGGYRRIDGYSYYDNTYQKVDDTNAEGAILGLAIFDNNGSDIVIAARKQKASSTYKFYYLSGGGWTAFAPGFTLNITGSGGTVSKIRHAKVVFEGQDYIVFVDGVNYATVFDGTNWYQLKSINTGTSASPGGDQLIDAPKYVRVFKNHVFLSGDYAYPEVVCHSSAEDVFNWTAAAGGGQLASSSKVKQIYPFRDVLYVFNKSSIRGISVSDTTFVINDVATNIGCIASDSVIEINGDILFMAQDGVRTVSGTDKIGDVNLATISRGMQKYINQLIETYDMDLLNSAVIKNKSQFRYYVSSASISALGVGLIGGIREGQNGIGWEFFKLSGIRTSVTEVGYIGINETVLHGDYDGSVYKQESGNSFNGSAITSVYATPYLTFGNPLLRKTPVKIHYYVKPEGDMTASVSTQYDWDSTSVVNVPAYNGSIASDVDVYDGGSVYDDPASIYAADTFQPIITLNTEGSFKSMKSTFTTSANQTAHTIQGIIIEFMVGGKR